jgi:hypothetical protein
MSSSSKIQPTDKTVVTDFKLQIVDLQLRLRNIAGAMAAHIPSTADLTSADFTVSNGKSALLNNVTTVVIVQSFSPFLVSLSNASGMITDIPCTGLFIVYGAFDSVEVKSVADAATRISYLYA